MFTYKCRVALGYAFKINYFVNSLSWSLYYVINVTNKVSWEMAKMYVLRYHWQKDNLISEGFKSSKNEGNMYKHVNTWHQATQISACLPIKNRKMITSTSSLTYKTQIRLITSTSRFGKRWAGWNWWYMQNKFFKPIVVVSVIQSILLTSANYHHIVSNQCQLI